MSCPFGNAHPNSHSYSFGKSNANAKSNTGTKFDSNTHDLEIVIWAHDYPERSANLEDRKEAIVAATRLLVAAYNERYGMKLTGMVSVLLQPFAFGKL